MNFKKLFLKHCENNQFEINPNQLDIIDDLEKYYSNNFNQSFFNKIFKKNTKNFLVFVKKILIIFFLIV